METATETTVNALSFAPTSDPNIFEVDGVSTDHALVQAIGTASNKPAKAKYYQFRDGVFAVIKDRGTEGFRLRAPRSTSSVPAKGTDPLEAYRALDVEMAQRRAQIRSGLEAKIAGLRERQKQVQAELDEQIRQTEEAIRSLSSTH